MARPPNRTWNVGYVLLSTCSCRWWFSLCLCHTYPPTGPNWAEPTVRRYSPAAFVINTSAGTRWAPFAIRPGFPDFGLLRVLRPIPAASAGNKPHPPTGTMLAGEGTGGMVPTFGSQSFDRVGAQLCPLQHLHGYAAGPHRGLLGRRRQPTKESPHTTTAMWVCVAARP